MKIRNYFKSVFVVYAALFFLMVAEQTFAGDMQLPQTVIQAVSETLREKLKDKVFTQDFAQVTNFVKGVIQPHADFDKITQLVLGKYWSAASPVEKERFKDEFQTLLVRAYSRAFVEHSDWDIQYLPLNMENNPAKVLVKTNVINQHGNQPVELNYRMSRDHGEWKVYDIIIDGVSLLTNYRSSIDEEIQKKGSLAAVIDDLSRRNTEALTRK